MGKKIVPCFFLIGFVVFMAVFSYSSSDHDAQAAKYSISKALGHFPHPVAVVYDSSNNDIYVTNLEGYVSVIDGRTYTIIKNITVGFESI